VTVVALLKSVKKTVAALVTGSLGWGLVVIASDSVPVTASEWLALGVVCATAFGVYVAPKNEP